MSISVEFKDLSFSYDNNHIIQNLNFTIKKGQFITLIGPSGCGKSTIFRLISDLEKPTSGKMIRANSAIGYMPQKDLLLPWRTVIDNVILPLQCQGQSKKEATKEASKLLAQFGLQNYAKMKPKDLSGGMRQRVSFARAMVATGDILLLDEPFSALDALTRMELQDWLKEQLHQLDKTVLFITHDVEEAIYLSDEVFVITEKPIQQIVVKKPLIPINGVRENLSTSEAIELKNQLLHLLKGGK